MPFLCFVVLCGFDSSGHFCVLLIKPTSIQSQTFMEEMTRKQPDVDKVTKTYKRKALEPTPVQSHIPVLDKGRAGSK